LTRAHSIPSPELKLSRLSFFAIPAQGDSSTVGEEYRYRPGEKRLADARIKGLGLNVPYVETSISQTFTFEWTNIDEIALPVSKRSEAEAILRADLF
jgi:hypothetical protein